MPTDTQASTGPNLPITTSQRHAVPFGMNADRVPRLIQKIHQCFPGGTTESQKQEEGILMEGILQGHS